MDMIHLGSQPSLPPFSLSQSLSSAVHTIYTHLPTHNSQIIYDPSAPNSAHIFVRVFDDKQMNYLLKFDPIYQSLLSVSYHVPTKTGSLCFTGQVNECLRYPISTDDLKQVYGDPISCHGDGNKNVALLYDGASFLFERKNGLLCLEQVKVGLRNLSDHVTLTHCHVTPAQSIIPATQTHFIVDNSTCRVSGLRIVQRSFGNKDRKDDSMTVYFGDHHEDVISKLGAPSSVYYKDHTHPTHVGMLAPYFNRSADTFLSYRERGIDVLLDSYSRTVTKLILHSNVPDHYQFCSYSRCCFEFSVTKNSLSTSHESHDNILVTPVTSWAVLKSQIETESVKDLCSLHYSPSTNSFYPFPNTSLHVVFDHMIFETTSSDNIATVTLLSHDSHMMLSRTCEECLAIDHSLGPFKQVNLNVQRSVLLVKERPPSEETFYDCEDDSFKSAQSSLQNELEQCPTNSADKNLDFKLDTHKLVVGPSVNIVSCHHLDQPSPSHPPARVCLLYEFSDSQTSDHISQSDTLKITELPFDDVCLQSEEESELNSFEMISLDDNHSESLDENSTQPNVAMTTEQEEPEFVYQPKSTTSNTIHTSMISSRTLTSSQTCASPHHSKSHGHFLSHTKSSQQRVRDKYTRPPRETASDEVEMASGRESFGEDENAEDSKVVSEDCSSETLQLPSQQSHDIPSLDNDTDLSHDNPSSSHDVEASPISNTDRLESKEQCLSVISSTVQENTSIDLEFNQTESGSSLNITAPPVTITEQSPTASISEDVKVSSSDVSSVTVESSEVPVLEPSDLKVCVVRRQWSEEEFTPDMGPPSMTQDKVLEELVSCEHQDVCDLLQQRIKNLHKVRELLCTPDIGKQEQLKELLTNDPSLGTGLMNSLTNSDGWTLSNSASLLPWILQLFSSDSQPRFVLQASQAVLCIAITHTALIVRHKIGRARSLSLLERAQCTKCYVTLEKVDESIENLITVLSNKTDGDNDLLTKLREVRTTLARIFRKLELE